MFRDDLLDSEAKMLEDMEHMQAFGSRLTGSKGHQEFIAWMKEQLNSMGLEVKTDRYLFHRWEEKKTGLFLQNEELPIASAYPYSGETGAEGITAELVCVRKGQYRKARGKIAVVEISVLKKIPLGLIMNKREGFPPESGISAGDGDLVLTSVLNNPQLKKAKEMGVKAVVLIWKGVSDERIENQYLPFTEDYLGIPAVWLNQTQGKKVMEAADKKQQATLILEAEKQADAQTESFYVTLEGKNKLETVLINSHTDGVNAVEENGAIGLLSLIRYFINFQPERTLVFVFVTGHFRLPVFKGSSQASSTWLMGHPDLWDGKTDNCKAVAGITVEHLGSMEWKEDNCGKYRPTGHIQTEYTYIGNKEMGRIWEQSLAGRAKVRTVTLRGHNKLQFGESQPLSEAKIPVIGLIQMPDYMMEQSERLDLDKFNVSLMREQVQSLAKAIHEVEVTSAGQLGKSDRYSFFFGKIH